MDSNENISKEAQNLSYHSLSPKMDKENHKDYCDALEWAISNSEKEDINNIALTGSYGSGKSSILKTFEERKIKDVEILKISLATFKEINFPGKSPQPEKSNSGEENGASRENGEQNKAGGSPIVNENFQLIELSILQQILYHEKNESIPDSRFKKIRTLKRKDIICNAILIFVTILSYYTFFHFQDLKTLLGTPEPLNWFRYIVLTLSLAFFLFCLFIILKRLISILQKLTVVKLNFQNLEIQLNENVDKSILNTHIDEILYFFEVTKYNVVIIEDLDRFEQTEIFTKLREINLLINNSKSVDRRVVFIYAIRDDMFEYSDRTKFFDFIIPVIPVVSYSNSKVQLKKALTAFGYNLSDDLIKQVSFYLDDMRLLYNCVNEFHIYFQKFKGKSNYGQEFKDKLFAIVLYKNLYPKDFFELGKNKGTLYEYINTKKTDWILKREDELNTEIQRFKDELDACENEALSNVEELNRLYLFEYLRRLPNLKNFLIDGKTYEIDYLVNHQNLEVLLGTNGIIYSINGYSRNNLTFSFNEIDKVVGKKVSYKNRLNNIRNKNKEAKERIIRQINAIDKEIKKIRNSKIKVLLAQSNIELPNKTKQDQLITLLLRNGYIAEDYPYYISYFYEGDITETDHWFIMNIKNEMITPFEYDLQNVKNVIFEIPEIDFEKPYILNYKVLDFLLKNEKFITKRQSYISQLANESSKSVDFIRSYIIRGNNLPLFIKLLCNNWKNIWSYFDNVDDLPKEEKEAIFYLILNKAEMIDIEEMKNNSSMISFIESQADFVEKIEDTTRLKDIIRGFDIKFNNLDTRYISDDITEYIYSNNNYAINPVMLALMIKKFGNYDEKKFFESNYQSVLESGATQLIDYIHSYINKYVESTYLKLTENREDSKVLIELLNHPEIESKNIINIIDLTNTQIDDVAKIENNIDLILESILEKFKMRPTWENVINIFDKGEGLLKPLIAYLNNSNTAEALSGRVYSNTNEEDLFKNWFLLLDEIDDSLYIQYLDSFAEKYSIENLQNLSKEKINGLVQKEKLVFTSKDFLKIKEAFSPLHIDYAINCIDDFIEEFNNIDILEKDISLLWTNERLKAPLKFKILELFAANNEITDVDLLTLIGELYLNHPQHKLSSKIIAQILLESNLQEDHKIELFLNERTLFDKQFITDFLSALGGKFKDLTQKGPMPTFENSKISKEFFDYLKSVNYVSKVIIHDEKNIKVTTFKS